MSTTNDTNYTARCAEAATAQGLDPAIAALTAADIDHRVAQTGGWVMVIEVPLADGYLAISPDQITAEGFLVCYVSAAAANGEEEEQVLADEVPASGVAAIVRQYKDRPETVFVGAWTARRCPDCNVWIYCDDGPFAEGDRTKTEADWLHYSRFHTPTVNPGGITGVNGADVIGFPYFEWNEVPVIAVRPPQ